MTASFWLIGAYLLLLPLIGYWARLRSREQSLQDYYLAGGMVGVLPLFFTLYATQYSGNTLLGFAGNAYRIGPVALFSGLGMMMVIVVNLTFARRLHLLAKQRGFITITDYFNHRYANAALSTLLSLVLVAALCSYVLTNFKAIGLMVASVSGGMLSLAEGVFIMALAMAIYESLGGMRSVIWTDMLQGTLLLAGCALVFAALLAHFGSPLGLLSRLGEMQGSQWPPMDAQQWRQGVSVAALFAVSVCMYPHSVQRIYAARNWRTLRIAFTLMLMMPLLTTLPIVLAAMSAKSLLPDIPTAQTDQVIPMLLAALSESFPWLRFFGALFMAAVIAAIMSTIDSALLAIGAALTRDVCKPLFGDLAEAALTRLGKYATWVLMFLLAGLATVLPQSIWALLVLKLEVMAQTAPALVLGVLLPSLKGRAVLCGLLAGLAATVAIKFGPVPRPFGVHAGIIGLGVNVVALSLVQGWSAYRARLPAFRLGD